MPRRTGKITRSEETIEDDNIEIERVEDDLQDNYANTMLNLDNLRDLIFLGRLSETVDIAGFKFVVSTLSGNQQREIMHQIMKFDQTERLLDIKPITVSYVIESVNEIPLAELCKDDSLTEDAERRLAVVLDMQSVVIEKIYQVYEKLSIASNKEIGLEDLKA